jgi:hypothetical protein
MRAAVVVVIVVAFAAHCHGNNGLWARRQACYFLVATEFDRLRLSMCLSNLHNKATSVAEQRHMMMLYCSISHRNFARRSRDA